MFVYIKHGDSEQFLTNTNCPIMLLLHYIRAKLGLPESGQSDGAYVSITPHVVNPDPALLEALQTQTESLEKSRLKQLRILEDRRSTGETPSQAQSTQQAKGKGKNVHMDTPDEEPQRRTGGRRTRN
ncbi:uncharacterized protein CXorf65 homolog [Clupea harengus]|uniref:Uncharacterized protein CXorf65 homolog n=1 Tax=Clupea harengus TaxID=7950 RepID=A0A8M1K4K2_CLUHA|nr:uncharacterized protein CXorf65 homolog [Clupea harengus]